MVATQLAQVMPVIGKMTCFDSPIFFLNYSSIKERSATNGCHAALSKYAFQQYPLSGFLLALSRHSFYPELVKFIPAPDN
jgi:hypothetical protein